MIRRALGSRLRARPVWVALSLLLALGCAREPVAQPAPVPSAEAAPVGAEPIAAPAPTAAAPLGFVETVTAGAGKADRLPLIIAVHGLGDRPENFIRLFEGLPFPARVVAPRGPDAHGRGHSWFPVRIPVERADPRMVAGVRSAAGKLAALSAWLQARRPTVGRPLITGFSQGGISSFAVAIHHPDAIAGAVPIAGALPAALWSGPGPSVPVVALHGEADRVVPFADGAALVDALAGRGVSARMIPFEGVAHSVPSAVRRALYETLAELAPTVGGGAAQAVDR